MKTLDEVIWAVENCDSAIDDCAHCAYYKEDCENLRPLRADALHYLKVLKDILDPLKVKKITHEITCPQCNSVIAILLPESNPPLTWQELRQMEGKPVWVEGGDDSICWNHKSWVLIRSDCENDDLIICQGADYGFAISKEDYCSNWQAYRKER